MNAHVNTAVLPRSLALAAQLLARPQVALSFSGDDDPLAINLPPLGPGAGGAVVDRETIEVMAALYFQAELEQTGLIAVAEVITDARFTLEVRDPDTAGALEDFARQMRGNWYPRPLREQLFARTFGYSSSHSSGADNSLNREFEPLFGQLCAALELYQSQRRWGAPPTGTAARVEFAAQALLANLARRRFGNTLIAAQRIQRQLQAALALLGQPGIQRLFAAQNLWGVIRNILGPDTPDLARWIERAQSGMRILGWLAQHHTALGGSALQQRLAAAPELASWASSWLQASGYRRSETPAQAAQPPSYYAQPPSSYGQPAAPGLGTPAPWSA